MTTLSWERYEYPAQGLEAKDSDLVDLSKEQTTACDRRRETVCGPPTMDTIQRLTRVCDPSSSPKPQLNLCCTPSTNPQFSVLNDAAHEHMAEIGEGGHEDVLRAFFRFRVADIGRLIKKVKDTATAAARNTGRNIVDFLPEANRIVISVLRSAFDYRVYNLGVYGIELPMIKPWTSRPLVIDVVLALFDASTKASEARSASGGAQPRSGEPYTQLADLAEILFACIQERLDWLGRFVQYFPPFRA